MTNEITKTNVSVMSHLARVNSDGDGFTTDDLPTPRLRLLQGQSESALQGKGKVGDYQDSLTGDIMPPPVEIVVISKKNGAVNFNESGVVICKSDDGITSIRGDSCSSCPYGAYWKEWVDNKPPACAATISFIVATKDTILGNSFSPYILSFKKNAIPPARNLARKIVAEKVQKGRQPYSRYYNLSSVKEKNDKNQMFAIPEFIPGDDLSPEELRAAADLSSFLSKKKIVENSTIADEEHVDEVVQDV